MEFSVIIYLLLSGIMPFNGLSHKELFRVIVKGEYSFPDPFWANVSPEAKELARNLLQVDPDDRWTARQALQCKWIWHVPEVALAQIDLGESARELKHFSARLKFRAAVMWLIWINAQ